MPLPGHLVLKGRQDGRDKSSIGFGISFPTLTSPLTCGLTALHSNLWAGQPGFPVRKRAEREREELWLFQVSSDPRWGSSLQYPF